MKAFDECDRRRDGKCIQFGNNCEPGIEIDLENKDWKKTCWRMSVESVYYMQCPNCQGHLWFDNHVTNRLGLLDIFYCPKCDKEVLRENALVLAKTLAKELKESEKFLEDVESNKQPFSFPGPRTFDEINHHKFNVKRLSDMIIRLSKGEKIQMNRNLTGLDK